MDSKKGGSLMPPPRKGKRSQQKRRERKRSMDRMEEYLKGKRQHDQFKCGICDKWVPFIEPHVRNKHKDIC